jgi:hypothetical protein
MNDGILEYLLEEKDRLTVICADVETDWAIILQQHSDIVSEAESRDLIARSMRDSIITRM